MPDAPSMTAGSMRLQDKVVLVTGAGKGTGRAAAEILAACGAQVAANDISPVNLDSLVEASHGRIRGYAEDIAKKVGVQALLKQVEDDFGRLDILVNHAAVEPRALLIDIDEWDWHRVLDVNLTGAFLAMQSAARMMREQRAGLILNLVSLSRSAGAHSAAYVASMHGLIGLTRAAARELEPFGIGVHALGRGLSEFELTQPGAPHDLQGALLFLCETRVSGQIINLEEP